MDDAMIMIPQKMISVEILQFDIWARNQILQGQLLRALGAEIVRLRNGFRNLNIFSNILFNTFPSVQCFSMFSICFLPKTCCFGVFRRLEKVPNAHALGRVRWKLVGTEKHVRATNGAFGMDLVLFSVVFRCLVMFFSRVSILFWSFSFLELMKSLDLLGLFLGLTITAV